MNAVMTARLVAAGRIGLGLGLIVWPGRVTAQWLGDDAGRPGTQTVTRGLGARDLALGLGALAAPESQRRPWVAAGIVADTADFVATVAAGDSLPLPGRILTGVLAAAGAALGVVALAGLRPSAPSS